MLSLTTKALQIYRKICYLFAALLLVANAQIAVQVETQAQDKPGTQSTDTTQQADLKEAKELSSKASKLYVAGKFDEAIPLLQRALALREKAFGTEHPEVAASLADFAELYKAIGDYARAALFFQRALAIREKTLGKDHLDVANSLNRLGLLYLLTSDYAKAEPLLQRALAIREKTLSAEDPRIATSLNNLAGLYKETGNYVKAESFFLRALAIQEKTLGKDHPDVATSLNNLGLLYQKQNHYAQAESLLQRALAIREKAFGTEHPEVAVSLNNLAGLYEEKGDYAKAELFLQRTLAIQEKTLGAEDPRIAKTLNNLGVCYKSRDDYAKAEPLLQRALAIREKTLGKDHPDVASSLNNLAQLYVEKGNYTDASRLFQRALTIQEKTLGKDHPDLVPLLNNLARLYQIQNHYAQAESLLQRALALAEQTLGKEHAWVANTLTNLVELHDKQGDDTKTLEYLIRVNDTREREFLRNLVTGSERQKLAYLNQYLVETYEALYVHINRLPANPEALKLAVQTVLRRKGRALDTMTDTLAVLRRNASAEDQQLLTQLTAVRSQYSNLVNSGASRENFEQFKARLKSLEEQEEQLEGEISKRSTTFRAQLLPINLEDIQRLVPVDAALVEFAIYRPYDAKAEQWGKARYVAYVLKNQGEPLWVDLGEAQAIDQLIQTFRCALSTPGTADSDRGKAVVNDGSPCSGVLNVKKTGRELEEKIFAKVRKLAGEKHRLIISPDGALNLIPFDALVDESNHYLIENYSITYLTSGRDLLKLQTPKASNQPPLVIADPDFGGTSARNQANLPLGPKLGNVQLQPFDRLFFSAVEGAELKKLFKGATVFTGIEATETRLKHVSGPAILHLSTHGVFLEDAPKTAPAPQPLGTYFEPENRGIFTPIANANMDAEKPLLRSGLFFAGANLGKSGDDDGVLTEREAMSLDLWGTKLVVLSACETGLGEIKNSEGVYGLRRAFVLAGAETQVMSLWSVNDASTKSLMVEYYKRLLAGEGRGEALRQVQLKMLKGSIHKHPYHWAGFILSGEWSNLDGKR